MSHSPATLISEDYRRMQQELHKNPHYGVASVEYAPLVAQVMEAVGATELLDYGAGKGRLGQTLREMAESPVVVHHYDPAIPEWSAPAQPCRFVACIDVLEHIEPHLIDNVLDDLQRVTQGIGVFTVHTGTAAKVLTDGRNAHLIQQPSSWWLPKFLSRFELVQFSRMPQGFWVSVEHRRQ
ncbi:MAG TPA: methyltransferase domain-containing protein [Burkholderiales bacterium]|nr:methyltransferase domain-containing protein [Burkholderiales bacterium]